MNDTESTKYLLKTCLYYNLSFCRHYFGHVCLRKINSVWNTVL